MEAKKSNNEKSGILKLGYVTNLKTCKAELNTLLSDEEQVSTNEMNAIVDGAQVVYLNRYGYSKDKQGNSITREKAAYLYIETGLCSQSGDAIIGWFERKPKEAVFKGVNWSTMSALEVKIKTARMFHWGDLYFESEEDGLKFLDDIAVNTIPETWAFKNKPSTVNHPILKSYLENTLEILKKEAEHGAVNKLVYSQDGKHLVFNTNLLDKFFHEVLIVAEVRAQKDGSKLLINPRRVKKDLELRKLNFPRDVKPEQPRFFERVEEVIYQPTWTIDKDFDKFTHIIEERRSRFPIDMQNASPDELGRKLDDAISFAVAIAQRNYKFIVPMYRPQTGKIQLLMPIYLKGTYSSKPDFALILTPDKENEYYTPETILPLDAVYQNARLIAKPDDTWLNPDTIL
ncbi:MAG: DUF3825 domain-containing protein [Bacteroidaceae bacterium]|nr:DUF3825 domain-containing protein [Bacteroidaceae bacterium]